MAVDRLTVVQVLPALDGGGVERGTLEIAQALVAAGHRAIVISNGGRLVADLEALGAEHITMPVGEKRLRTLTLVAKVRRWLEQHNVDVVHVRSRLPAWIVWMAWRGMRTRLRPALVSTVHGLYSVSRYSAVMTKGERVIVVSKAVRDYVHTHYPDVDPARVRLIYRGIDHDRFRYGYRPSDEWQENWRQEFNISPSTLKLLLPGRLTRLKGHDYFLRLIEHLCKRGVPVVGLVAGGEDPRRRTYARQLYASARQLPVHFLGQRSDLRELMASVDIVLSLSSKPESFGRTVLEALSLGVPVVGFDHGGVGEVLAHMYAEGRVPMRDEDALRSRVLELWERPVPVPKTDAFPLQAMQSATLALYQEVANNTATSDSAARTNP